MALRSTGEMDIDAMNEMNVPVVCWLLEPETEGEPWSWSAVNFMPRKECCGSSWRIEADSKDEILEFVRQRVVPLYRAALENLESLGENYYWEQI